MGSAEGAQSCELWSGTTLGGSRPGPARGGRVLRRMVNRRHFLGISAGALASHACSAVRERAEGSAPPNVLFIAVDDLNTWLGCMRGHPQAKTPNMDRLAERGVVFHNAHCQAPICGPSRASLMSGYLPSTTGIYGQINDGDLREASPETGSTPFLPEWFANHGYHTMGVGKLFHNHAPEGAFVESGGRVRGFGPRPPERMRWNADRTSTDWGPFPDRDEEMPDFETARWAAQRLGREYSGPFFLGAGFLRPHVPWHVPKRWFDLFPADELEMPPYLPGDQDDLPEISRELHALPMMPTTSWAIESGEWKNIVQAYLACVAFVDAQVGKVVEALEAGPNAGNTYVVLWGDHGYHIGEKDRFGKHSVWEEATRTPLIVAGPGIRAGNTVNPAGLIDLYPTLLDLCGLPANPASEGHSLRPLLDNPETADWPHVALTTYGRNNHGVRDVRYRYIRYEDGSEELYDHEGDAHEWHNLANVPSYEPIKRRLADHLPEVNAPWSAKSVYDYNQYLTKHRERNL